MVSGIEKLGFAFEEVRVAEVAEICDNISGAIDDGCLVEAEPLLEGEEVSIIAVGREDLLHPMVVGGDDGTGGRGFEYGCA
jgi:hypothetical protein